MAAPWHPLAPHWPGLRAGRALVLPLPTAAFAGLPPRRDVDGFVLVRKREFHVTLLSSTDSARLADALAALPRMAARQWRREAMAFDWRWRPSGEQWLLARGSGKRDALGGALSIAALLEQPAQARFRVLAGELLGTPLPAPMPHVTLYVHGDPAGIGVPDLPTFHARRIRLLL